MESIEIESRQKIFYHSGRMLFNIYIIMFLLEDLKCEIAV